MSGSSFLWISVISFNFKGSGKSSVLRELFIHLHKTCGNILFPFKNLKGISPPEDFVLTNVEITSRTSLRVTGRKEKGNVTYTLKCNVFALDFSYAGVAFVFISNTFDWSWFI